MNEFIPVKLDYKVFEPEKGNDNNNLCPIIYLHGLTDVKSSFDRIAQIVSDETGRKGYAYDARHHGNSGKTGLFSFKTNIDDLFYFMDTMKISKAVLVGHSMGGNTANRAALQKPERVESIFVEDMYVKKMTNEIDLFRMYVEAFLSCIATLPNELDQTRASEYIADFMTSKKLPGTVKDKEKLYKGYLNRIHKVDGKYHWKFNKDAILYALTKRDILQSDPTGQYDGPAYFICGSESFMGVKNDEENIKKHFPKAEIIEIEGAYHCVRQDFPEDFIQILVQRLKP